LARNLYTDPSGSYDLASVVAVTPRATVLKGGAVGPVRAVLHFQSGAQHLVSGAFKDVLAQWVTGTAPSAIAGSAS
jgi:hypothetical protein